MKAVTERGKRETKADVVRHPVRVRLMEVCTARGSLSPIEFVNQGIGDDLESMQGKTPKRQLSHVSYHCRELEKNGFLTMVDERPVRGATEHFYRSSPIVYLDDEEWGALSLEERRELSWRLWEGFAAHVRGAMHGDTLDARPDRILAWRAVDLDEQAWREVKESMLACLAEVEEIKRGAEARLAESEAEPLRVTWGLFQYEAPAQHRY